VDRGITAWGIGEASGPFSSCFVNDRQACAWRTLVASLICHRGQTFTAGFEDFEIVWRGDIYRDAPQQTAGFDFGIMGISYRARKSG